MTQRGIMGCRERARYAAEVEQAYRQGWRIKGEPKPASYLWDVAELLGAVAGALAVLYMAIGWVLR